MTGKRRLLVDFENVQALSLAKLPEDLDVAIFVGSSQKSIPIELVRDAQKLGKRIEWIKVDGNGSNALDFHIAYYMGRWLVHSPKLECIVLSRDRGFDPLLAHLTGNGHQCRRIESLAELKAAPAAAPDPNYLRVMELLTKLATHARPRTRATLIAHLSAMFHKKLPEAEITRMVDRLFAEGKVAEGAERLSYSL